MSTTENSTRDFLLSFPLSPKSNSNYNKQDSSQKKRANKRKIIEGADLVFDNNNNKDKNSKNNDETPLDDNFSQPPVNKKRKLKSFDGQELATPNHSVHENNTNKTHCNDVNNDKAEDANKNDHNNNDKNDKNNKNDKNDINMLELHFQKAKKRSSIIDTYDENHKQNDEKSNNNVPTNNNRSATVSISDSVNSVMSDNNKTPKRDDNKEDEYSKKFTEIWERHDLMYSNHLKATKRRISQINFNDDNDIDHNNNINNINNNNINNDNDNNKNNKNKHNHKNEINEDMLKILNGMKTYDARNDEHDEKNNFWMTLNEIFDNDARKNINQALLLATSPPLTEQKKTTIVS